MTSARPDAFSSIAIGVFGALFFGIVAAPAFVLSTPWSISWSLGTVAACSYLNRQAKWWSAATTERSVGAKLQWYGRLVASLAPTCLSMLLLCELLFRGLTSAELRRWAGANFVIARLQLGSIGPIFYAVVAAPYIEELCFRGWVLSGLREMIGSRAAVLVSALMFGSLHFWYPSLGMVLIPVILGVFWGTLRIRFDSMLVATALHAFWNSLVIARLKGMTLVPSVLDRFPMANATLAILCAIAGGLSLAEGIWRVARSAPVQSHVSSARLGSSVDSD
ncbi:MAG: CPBP family intramembrane metalloprotease [Gemmatimonadaceae bacterium]|nr:CPBP family intramembrane metalloprotease [Gemmatimonadaceae bacterium]